jgi:hypothetical protein
VEPAIIREDFFAGEAAPPEALLSEMIATAFRMKLDLQLYLMRRRMMREPRCQPLSALKRRC